MHRLNSNTSNNDDEDARQESAKMEWNCAILSIEIFSFYHFLLHFASPFNPSTCNLQQHLYLISWLYNLELRKASTATAAVVCRSRRDACITTS